MTSIVSSVAVVCLLSVPASIVAQQPSAAPQPVEKGSTTNGTPAPAPPYSYDPQGRRDPFLSLIARGSDPGSAATRPAGLPGLLISEVAVKGVVRDRSGLIAMVQGPGTKTFIVRPGEKLMDGTVKAITNDSVVFSQDVNDPLSMVKQKEVRKTVRSADGGRE
jgi:Tfp pilus assembly protein PilP